MIAALARDLMNPSTHKMKKESRFSIKLSSQQLIQEAYDAVFIVSKHNGQKPQVAY